MQRTGTINLELDDQGNPYYIQTLYKEYGVSGRMHYNEFKTAVLNATTGEVNVYDSQKPQVSLMRRLLVQRRIA